MYEALLEPLMKDQSIPITEEDRKFHNTLRLIEKCVTEHLSKFEYTEILELYANSLTPAINEFMDKCLVRCENIPLSNIRYLLTAWSKELMDRYGIDFASLKPNE